MARTEGGSGIENTSEANSPRIKKLNEVEGLLSDEG